MNSVCNKQIHQYSEVEELEIGRQAYVRKGNHICKTEPVVSIFQDGVFETALSRYVPENFSPQRPAAS